LRELRIPGPMGTSRLIVGESALRLENYLHHCKNVIIIDKKVRRLNGIPPSLGNIIEIEACEGAKTLGTVEQIYRKFIEFGIDRSTCVVGIGGGVVCDITGFSASTYLRGLPFGFVPTTLLAQADASVGGKNGVNLDGYKNLVGLFRQPDFVLIDFEFLKTLPKKELASGAAEIIKHALIKSRSLFHYLEREWRGLLRLEGKVVERVVLQSVLIKSKVVRADSLEKGERRKLNFGHTLGHAIERAGGFRHGEAVSLGMASASQMSLARGMLSREEVDRVRALLENVELPTRLPPLNGMSIIDALRKDKKRRDDAVYFVLLSGLGRAEVTKISDKELEDEVNDLCQSC
jgi:3-dehydroquinate synthase